MRIGFLGLPVPGHMNPMTALARKLRSRGHEVVFFGLADSEPFVRAAGLTFVPFGEEEYPTGSVARDFASIARMVGLDVLWSSLETSSPVHTKLALEHLPAKMAEAGVEGLVVDTVFYFAQVAAMGMGLPFVQVWAVLPNHPDGAIPPFFADWPHETTPEVLARNAEAMAQYHGYIAPIARLAQPYAEKAGLTIDWSDPGATDSKLAVIAQTPAAFDYPGVEWPAEFHHTGPFHDDEGRAPVPFAWEELDGRPLVYASLGTMVNAQATLFMAIMEAAAGLPEAQFVFSIGKNVSLADLGTIPANLIAVPFTPQIELLKRAALCITHAGLNTTLEALGLGVPMVAIPIGFDQPGNAARIAYHRVGEFIEVEDLTAEGLLGLIREVLGDPSYRANARELQAAIAKARGLDMACEVIERAFGESPKPA